MEQPIIQKIGQIGLPVQNMQRAIDFYKDVLGLPLLFQTDNMAFFDCNGQRLLLSLPEKEQFAHPGSVLYFQVEDIQESFAALQAKGAAFSGKPHMVARMGQTETWMAFFTDSEHNTHALMSEVQA
jgi:methylmalonyl-CoA/ethylmalonyl-CoA epimerase